MTMAIYGRQIKFNKWNPLHGMKSKRNCNTKIDKNTFFTSHHTIYIYTSWRKRGKILIA